MWIDLDEAIRIYARMLRSRFGSKRGAKLAQESAHNMLAKSDLHGAKVWEAVASELTAQMAGARDSVPPADAGERIHR